MYPEGVYPHECIEENCTTIVHFDDEPWCLVHSPDEGSFQIGYSARVEAEKKPKINDEMH